MTTGIAEYYNLLRVPIDATAEEIRSAYFAATRAYHPDVNPAPEARQLFIRVQEAYEVLSNPQRRATYDANIPSDLRKPPPVALEWILSRTIIPRLNEPQLIYLMLDLRVTTTLDPTVGPPVHICLVVDRSTSMRGERIEMVKQGIGYLVRNLRPNDLISLIAFGDRAEVILHATPIQHQIDILHAVNQLQVSGGTEILRGIEMAVNLSRYANHLNNTSTQIWLITDGHTYGDEQASIELAASARQEGITINAFGIGEDWNDDFLDALTSIAGGSAHYIQHVEDLYLCFERKGRSTKQTFARGLELHFTNNSGINIRYAFKLGDEVAPLVVEPPMPLGDLYYDQKMNVVMELLIPQLSPEITEIYLLRGKLTMEIPSLEARFWRIPFSVACEVGDEVESVPVPEILLQSLSRLTLYRMQERARQEISVGEISRAARRLQYLATHLLAKGERALARTVLLEAEHLHRTHQLSGERGKQIKYGTRSLLMLPEPRKE
ncbi:VWA domain-containing protein [Thermanaerothrix sp. 4228-RoL]|uniref:VWA domain-containing protein n=2 Tax=Thermanaerothrix TaxID=1077886 RepID=A0ABU3NKB6_9CHLR|nr:DnaJ domain-containing protein [Thermanaerothrix sp. 4228-RoL]MDT8897264.1 VWA domain-containing protein [Thermanaerothrix sp. 4228-RoL]